MNHNTFVCLNCGGAVQSSSTFDEAEPPSKCYSCRGKEFASATVLVEQHRENEKLREALWEIAQLAARPCVVAIARKALGLEP